MRESICYHDFCSIWVMLFSPCCYPWHFYVFPRNTRVEVSYFYLFGIVHDDQTHPGVFFRIFCSSFSNLLTSLLLSWNSSPGCLTDYELRSLGYRQCSSWVNALTPRSTGYFWHREEYHWVLGNSRHFVKKHLGFLLLLDLEIDLSACFQNRTTYFRNLCIVAGKLLSAWSKPVASSAFKGIIFALRIAYKSWSFPSHLLLTALNRILSLLFTMCAAVRSFKTLVDPHPSLRSVVSWLLVFELSCFCFSVISIYPF